MDHLESRLNLLSPEHTERDLCLLTNDGSRMEKEPGNVERNEQKIEFIEIQTNDQNPQPTYKFVPLEANSDQLDKEDLFISSIENFQKARIFIHQASSFHFFNYDLHGKQLKYYKIYMSSYFTFFRVLNLIILLSLAYFEDPATIVVNPAIPITFEIICLMYLLFELHLRYLIFGRRALNNKWNIIKFVAILVCFIDIWVHFQNRPLRILRCLFVIDYSSSTHQLFRDLCRTWYRLLPALFTVMVWIGLCALIATVIFFRDSPIYFPSWTGSFISLFTAMTTVNFPDVIIPSYRDNPILTILFFSIYMSISYLFYIPMSIAIVYRTFRETVLNDHVEKSKAKRGALQKAFKYLDRGHNGKITHETFIGFLEYLHLDSTFITGVAQTCKEILGKEELSDINFMEFRKLCDSILFKIVVRDDILLTNFNKFLHKSLNRVTISDFKIKIQNKYFDVREIVTNDYFEYFVTAMILGNGILFCWLTFDIILHPFDPIWLLILDLFFLAFFMAEVITRTLVLGIFKYSWNIFDLLMICLTLVGELLVVAQLSKSYNYEQIAMLLSCARFLRIFTATKRIRILVKVIFQLFKMMSSFVALLLMLYYTFAIVAIALYDGYLVRGNPNLQGSLFDAADYYDLIGFNDFAQSMTTLFHMMIQNNWHVTAQAIIACTNSASFLFFIVYWFTTTLVVLNIIIAFTIDSVQHIYNALSTPQSQDVLSLLVEETTKNLGQFVEQLFSDDVNGKDEGVIDDNIEKKEEEDLQELKDHLSQDE